MSNPWAFPGSIGNSGMSLRDYFAASVLMGIVGVCAANPVTINGHFVGNQALARWAYDLADAMLAERERTTNDR